MIELVPLTRDAANALIAELHRHHGRVDGHRFAIGAEVDGKLVGAAIVARPKARALEDGFTAEVVRLVTDGTPHVASKLYAASWRAWRAMGGRRLYTYTLVSEPGTSVVAAGWKLDGSVPGREWGCDVRPREAKGGAQVVDKNRWLVTA